MKNLLVVLVSLRLTIAKVEDRAGFSLACQGARTLAQVTKTAEIVTEARVVDVSPARDNVYAVTLQVRTYHQVLQGLTNVMLHISPSVARFD